MNNNDRELLELAARAAGWKFMPAGTMESVAGWFDPSNGDMHWEDIWNPLTDDGDALRLAVKLRIDLHIYPDHASATSVAFDESQHYPCFEEFDKDRCASVRRAIVRAAAEIGKRMEGGNG